MPSGFLHGNVEKSPNRSSSPLTLPNPGTLFFIHLIQGNYSFCQLWGKWLIHLSSPLGWTEIQIKTSSDLWSPCCLPGAAESTFRGVSYSVLTAPLWTRMMLSYHFIGESTPFPTREVNVCAWSHSPAWWGWNLNPELPALKPVFFNTTLHIPWTVCRFVPPASGWWWPSVFPVSGCVTAPYTPVDNGPQPVYPVPSIKCFLLEIGVSSSPGWTLLGTPVSSRGITILIYSLLQRRRR